MSVETSEAGGQIVFEGGHAVAQHDTPESSLAEDERTAAKAAVKKAMEAAAKEESEESEEPKRAKKAPDPYKPEGAKKEPKKAKEPEEDTEEPAKPSKGTEQPSERPRAQDGKFSPKTPKEPVKGQPEAAKEDSEEEALDIEKANVKTLLKKREKVAELKRQAANEEQQAKAQLEQFRAQVQQEQYAVQQQMQELARKRQEILNFQKDPASAIRAGGYDPEKFILDLAQEGTPEGKQKRQLEALQSQIDQVKNFHQQQMAAYQRQQAVAQQEQVRQARISVEKEFTDLAKNEEKYPLTSMLTDGPLSKVLVAWGDIAAHEFRELSGGREGDFPDILDYIEDSLAERFEKYYIKKYGAPKAKSVPAGSGQSKPSSSGKSLSPNASGERRALERKGHQDVDGDERLEAARQAVREALKAAQDDDE